MQPKNSLTLASRELVEAGPLAPIDLSPDMS